MATEVILNALANAVVEGDDDLAEEFAQKALDEGGSTHIKQSLTASQRA